MKLQETVYKKFIRLEQLVHTYLQLKMILDEIKLTTQDAVLYLENLKSHLTRASAQRVTKTPGRCHFLIIKYLKAMN